MDSSKKQKHSYNLGVIGNCAWIGLIDNKADIRWLCWPQFDSGFVFGSLLDDEKGGEFSILPQSEEFSTHQYYIENTNVLCTEFTSAQGVYKVTDFAPRFPQYERYYKPLMLVRKIEPLSGEPVIRIKCNPVIENGKQPAGISLGSNHLQYTGFRDEVRLTTDISLNFIRDNKPFILTEPRYLVLTYGIPLENNLEYTCEDFLRKTTDYWRNWVKSTYITPFHQEFIIRSALVIKLHQFEQTGAIIAAPTTSLPEAPGSERTWDYRYCWLRDTYYTLTAFNNVGHFEELEGYFNFIANVTLHHRDRLQPLYSIDGNDEIPEKILPLKGYLGMGPVRFGNAAYFQTQNDVYGQVLVSLLPLYTDKRLIRSERQESVKLVKSLLRMIDETMEEEDAGLWEYRNRTQQHAYTFLFHWAGCQAAQKIFAATNQSPEIIEYARSLKYKAAAQLEKCYNPEIGAYCDSIDSKHLDASLLQLVTMGYLDPHTEKAQNHLKAMEKKLMSDNRLFYRYKHEDDFGNPETTFLICSFWYVDALAATGRAEEAIRLFEELLGYTNHLGLLSEDVDAVTGSQWGNFPQTYSHVGQINAAFSINKVLNKPNFI